MNHDARSITEKLLLTGDIIGPHGAPFTQPALVVASWQRWPDTFGLKGYEQLYPNSNKVASELSMRIGPVKRGWFVRQGPNLYAVTEDGRRQVDIINGVIVKPEPTRQLSREHSVFFLDMTTSEAVLKFHLGRKEEVTFAEACQLWQVREHRSIVEALTTVTRMLAELEQATADGDRRTFGGRVVSASEVRVLANVDGWLRGRFERKIDVMRQSGKGKVAV